MRMKEDSICRAASMIPSTEQALVRCAVISDAWINTLAGVLSF